MANAPITNPARLLPAGPRVDLVLEACRAFNALTERRLSPPTADEWFGAWRLLRSAAELLTGESHRFVDDRAEAARHAGIRVLSDFYAGQGPACRFDDDAMLSPHYRALYAIGRPAAPAPARKMSRPSRAARQAAI